jgi:hypothetical protein
MVMQGPPLPEGWVYNEGTGSYSHGDASQVPITAAATVTKKKSWVDRAISTATKPLTAVGDALTSLTTSVNNAVFGGPAGRVIGEIESIPVIGPIVKYGTYLDKPIGEAVIGAVGGQVADVFKYPGVVADVAIKARAGTLPLEEVNLELSKISPLLHGPLSTYMGSNLGKETEFLPFKNSASMNKSSAVKAISDLEVIAAETAVVTGAAASVYGLGSLAVAAGIPSVLASGAAGLGIGDYLGGRASRNIAKQDIAEMKKEAAAALAAKPGDVIVNNQTDASGLAGGGAPLVQSGTHKKKKKTKHPSTKERRSREEKSAAPGSVTQNMGNKEVESGKTTTPTVAR